MIQWLKQILGRSPPKELDNKTLIWGVTGGPFLPEDYGEDPEDVLYEAVLVCKVQAGGEVFAAEVHFDSCDDAYEMMKYFDTNIEPVEVSHGYLRSA